MTWGLDDGLSLVRIPAKSFECQEQKLATSMTRTTDKNISAKPGPKTLTAWLNMLYCLYLKKIATAKNVRSLNRHLLNVGKNNFVKKRSAWDLFLRQFFLPKFCRKKIANPFSPDRTGLFPETSAAKVTVDVLLQLCRVSLPSNLINFAAAMFSQPKIKKLAKHDRSFRDS